MSFIQQGGYYYYRKSTIMFFTNNGEKQYDNLIKKQQYLAWLDLPQEQKNIFESVALFCNKNQISQYDQKTRKPLKPPIPFFLFFRVVEERLKKDNPTLKQSQIFRIAENRWKNDLIQRIKDQFTKIHQILELSYNYEIMQYKKMNIQYVKDNLNQKIIQQYSISSPGIKFNTLTRQSLIYRNKLNYKIITQPIIAPMSLTTTDSEYVF